MQLLLKHSNHRKINSHEWFFMAHVPNTSCPFAFTTDTGAVFRPRTVDMLSAHLEAHTNCVAVTGRQRVMSEGNQRVLGRGFDAEHDSWFEWCLRCLQGYDFELDHVSGKAANCSAGLLPCLHGPCAMFRYIDIDGRCLEEYFDTWGYAPPNALTLLGANLQLAEDRIPSLLGVLYSGKCSDSVFDAVFEFEAELSLKAFVTQRRRWGNGALASLVFAMTKLGNTLSSSHSIAFKVANVSIFVLQVVADCGLRIGQ